MLVSPAETAHVALVRGEVADSRGELPEADDRPLPLGQVAVGKKPDTFS
jgi:hypothetical protein